MRTLNSIKKDEIRDLLGSGWLTHDGMWFFNTSRELGIDTANKLNRMAIKSMSVIEAERLRKILGIEKQIETFDEVKKFIREGMQLILPYSVFSKFHTSVPSRNVLHWEWQNQECFAYKGMKRAGLIGEYECGVIYRIECWFQALGIEVNTHPRIERCMMHEKGCCSGDFEFFFNK